MKILGLELSSAGGSVAWRDNDVRFARDFPNDRQNSGAFFANLAALRNEFGLPDMIVVGLGPGSYAGIRIAISAAIGLQSASQARLVGFPSICAIESDVTEYTVVGDARRQSFFLARVYRNDLVEGPSLMAEAELRINLDKLHPAMPTFATEKLRQFDRTTVRYPSAQLLTQLASNPERAFAQPPLEPIYLREPYVTTPKK